MTGITPLGAPELLPEEQAAAVALFGSRLAGARGFADALCTSGVDRGLIGPREVERIWSRHVLNCAVVAELIPDKALVIDVGSGAGLPGIALAVARPDLRVVLLEPMLRRTTWLTETVEALALDNVRVVRGRAEDVVDLEEVADVVTARAVAPLPRLAAWCLTMVRPGGLFLALKGETARAELDGSVAALRDAGAVSWGVVECGGDGLAEPTRVVRVVAGARVVATQRGQAAQRGEAAQRGGRGRRTARGPRPPATGGRQAR